MKKINFPVLIALFVLLHIPIAHSADLEEKKSLKTNPFDVFEKCLKLKPTKTLHYSFKASKPVDFSIHYFYK